MSGALPLGQTVHNLQVALWELGCDCDLGRSIKERTFLIKNSPRIGHEPSIEPYSTSRVAWRELLAVQRNQVVNITSMESFDLIDLRLR